MKSVRTIFQRPRYLAVAWIFASLNLPISTWVLYIPTVKTRLGLDAGQLGQALFCMSLGMFLVIPLAPRLLRTLGLGRGTFLALMGVGAVLALPILAPSYALLCAALFAFGALLSITDIGMNALAAEVETADGPKFLAAAHGFFSLGGVLGAGLGSLLIGAGISPLTHALGTAGVVLLTNLLFVRRYLHHRGRQTAADAPQTGGFDARLIVPMLPLVVLAALTMGSEGSIEHWSKLFLLDVANSSERAAGFGFVVFSAAMTMGRFFGDGISDRFGSDTLVRGGNLLAALGYGFVLIGRLEWSLLGFALVGLGFSVIIPELFRLAGRAPGVDATSGIAVVAGLGYVGFLLSPALLGYLADWGGLRLSFATLAGAALVGVLVRPRSWTGSNTRA